MSKLFYSTILTILSTTSFVKPQFNEEYSKKLIKFVAASFLPPFNDSDISSNIETKKLASLCFEKSYPNGNDWELLNIAFMDPCTRFNIDLCQILIAKSVNFKEIIFAFQGYVYPEQINILENLNFDQFIPWNIEDDGSGNGGSYGKVISDFYEASEAVWNDSVKGVLNEYSDYLITFTGHSLGGSIASLMALKTKIFGFNQTIKVYTFGEPRVGDSKWAKIFKAKIPEAYRVVHSSDLLPHMPVCQGYFSGTCENKPGYPYHEPQEIWYNDYLMSDGKYIICDKINGEGPNCSNSITETEFDKNLIEWQGFDMQMRYYNHRLYDYGNAGCEDVIINSNSSSSTVTTKVTTAVTTVTTETSTTADADAVLFRNNYFIALICYYYFVRYYFL